MIYMMINLSAHNEDVFFLNSFKNMLFVFMVVLYDFERNP